MVSSFLDPSGNEVTVSAARPMPVTGGGGSSGGTNANPMYEKGAYAVTSDDLAQSANATSTTLAAQDGVDFQSIAISLIALTVYTGTVFFEVSNDGTNWTPKLLINNNSGNANTVTGASSQAVGGWQQWSGDLGARYIRVRQTSYTAGQLRVIAVASALSTATIPTQSIAISGQLPAGTNVIGRTNILDNNGNQYESSAASTAATAVQRAMVVGLSPNSPLPAGSNAIGGVSLTGQTNTESGTLGALNATAGGVADLGSMSQVQVQVTGSFNGNVQFEVSNDGTNWVSKVLIFADSVSRGNSTGSPGMLFGHIGARYFRARMSSYTSGSAVVTVRYNAASGEMPINRVVADISANAGMGDGVTLGNVGEVALGAYNGGSIDRLVTAQGAASTGSRDRALTVAGGLVPTTSISGASAPVSGTNVSGGTARAAHTMQVDVTTATAGTAGSHSVILEGSLDGVYFTSLGTVSPAATSTTATDATNHANVSVVGFPYQVVRARWASIPTSWVGTLTARVASA